jgi:hypothetical protein
LFMQVPTSQSAWERPRALAMNASASFALSNGVKFSSVFIHDHGLYLAAHYGMSSCCEACWNLERNKGYDSLSLPKLEDVAKTERK